MFLMLECNLRSMHFFLTMHHNVLSMPYACLYLCKVFLNAAGALWTVSWTLLAKFPVDRVLQGFTWGRRGCSGAFLG